MLAGIDFYLGPSKEIVFAGSAEPFLPILRAHYLPRAVAGVSADRPAIGGKPTAYVCQNFTCKHPVTEPQQFAGQLSGETGT
jgi:uncharacterized protein YyaL (SSP411 family)